MLSSIGMSLFPQFFHDSQTLQRRQTGIRQRIGPIGFVETAEDMDFLLHASLQPSVFHHGRLVNIVQPDQPQAPIRSIKHRQHRNLPRPILHQHKRLIQQRIRSHKQR